MLELEHEFRVVDVHARLQTGAATPAGTTPLQPDRLEREMHQAGIVRSVVFPPVSPETSYVAANNGVARHSVERPFIAFARINGVEEPTTNAGSRFRNAFSRQQSHHTTPEDVEQYAYDDRFHGFVLDPAADGLPTDDVLDVLEDVSLPLIVSGGDGAPSAVLADRLFDRSFPVIVSHFGGHPLNRKQMHETIDRLEGTEDCYLETSAVRYRDVLERALLEHPDRVFFGSGVPDCHPNVAIMEILTLDVSADKLRRAFSKNACRVVEGLGPQW
ncbi:amidohydrolase family protein [Halobacteria archaeon AArc-curdl1]|uniref:Amidohydrolase family protein n=1 Tax=Natronosalvus hydrolyticus TaxID=2979988 RepID=A0AAP3E5C4_9EURY|nr:amidohydrolase family protein [Halobacteria archaeon AArc-curdl1]